MKREIALTNGLIELVLLDIFQPYQSRVYPYKQPFRCLRFLYEAAKVLNEVMNETHDKTNTMVIHVHNPLPNLIPYLMTRKIRSKRISIVCTIHHFEETYSLDSMLSKIISVPYQYIIETNIPCNVIHVPSRYVKETLVKKRFFYKKNIIIIPPGIDLDRYLANPKKHEDGLFIMIGRLEPRKHYDHAIAAFKIVAKHRPDYKLVIIGDGPLKHELIQLIERYGLERNVFLLSSVDEETKLKLLSRVEALIHLGYPEGFGIVILEALASGTPVIAYNVPPINEIVKNGTTGVLVKKDSIIDLAKAIMNIDRYSFDPNELRRSTKKYDINTIVNKFKVLYRYLATELKR